MVTENLDIILYGCSKICFDLNSQGYGVLLDSDSICDAIKMKADNHTFDKFKYMCILSGCDYIEPLQGIDLQQAHQFISSIEDTNPETVSIRLFFTLLNLFHQMGSYTLMSNSTSCELILIISDI